MGCSITNNKVCLVPGVDAFEMTGTSAGKVCMGRTPFRFDIQLPFGNDPFTEPQVGDPGTIFMQTYQPARLNHVFISTILDGGLTPIPRDTWDELDIFIGGFWYESDNWLSSVPTNQTPQNLGRGIPLGALDCENYVRCYGNPIPRSCLPTFKSTENLASLTWGYLGTDQGPLTLRGMVVLDYGMVPLAEGKCYMENPVPGIDPSYIAEAQAAATTTQGDRPAGSGQ